jgi:hypothetical protein
MCGSSHRKQNSLPLSRIRADRYSGVPHSLQGLKGGVEFLLVFDDGSFSEDNTFLASEVFAHNPVRRVLL